MILLVLQILRLLSWIVVADAVLSWVQPDTSRFPRSVTSAVADPLCAPVRAVLNPRVTGGIDFSPLVVFLVLELLAGALARLPR